MTPTATLFLAIAGLLLIAHVSGRLATRVNQPAVIGEILVGVLIGPTILGSLAPGVLSEVLASDGLRAARILGSVALVVFMFDIGRETDPEGLRANGRRALGIGVASVLAPLAGGAAIGIVAFESVASDSSRLSFALFVGTALAVTAFPVLARILEETGLRRRPIGTLAIAVAAVDDLIAWVLLSVSIATVDGGSFGTVLRPAVAVVLVILVAVAVERRPPVRFAPGPTVLFAMALTGAALGEIAGVHAIIGAFAAGLITGRAMTKSGTGSEIDEASTKVTGLLLPLFFILAGMSVDLRRLDDPAAWLLLGATLVVAIVGKYGATRWAASRLGSTPAEARILGALMNTRGVTGIIVLTVGLDRGVISGTVFAVLMVVALVTTMMTKPWLTRLGVGAVQTPGQRPDTR